MLRRQWTESERLTYPAIQLPLALTHEIEAKDLFKSRLMWAGFALALLIEIVNGLNFLDPTIPAVPGVKFHSIVPYFSEWPLSAIGRIEASMYPFMIGLAFFLPSDLAFSCWFFHLLVQVELVAGAVVGWSDVPNFPYLDEQATGGWIALALAALWASRRYLGAVFRRAFGLDKTVRDEGEPLPYRWAVVGLFSGLAILFAFCWVAGMAPLAIIAFFVIYLLVAISISRVRAEFGTPHVVRSGYPQKIMGMVGTKFFPKPTLTVMGCFWWFNRRYGNHPMPNQLEAFKMAQVADIDNRKLSWVILLSTVVAMLFTYWSQLHLTYQDGALLTPGVKSWVGSESFNNVAAWIKTPAKPDARIIVVFICGFAFTLLLRAARGYFFRWPFHPAGYILGTCEALRYTWFCFFIAWLIKSVLSYVGGNRSRRAAIPFFMGLMLGDFTGGVFWSSLGAILRMRVYKTFI
jgi:hypothetical protein